MAKHNNHRPGNATKKSSKGGETHVKKSRSGGKGPGRGGNNGGGRR